MGGLQDAIYLKGTRERPRDRALFFLPYPEQLAAEFGYADEDDIPTGIALFSARTLGGIQRIIRSYEDPELMKCAEYWSLRQDRPDHDGFYRFWDRCFLWEPEERWKLDGDMVVLPDIPLLPGPFANKRALVRAYDQYEARMERTTEKASRDYAERYRNGPLHTFLEHGEHLRQSLKQKNGYASALERLKNVMVPVLEPADVANVYKLAETPPSRSIPLMEAYLRKIVAEVKGNWRTSEQAWKRIQELSSRRRGPQYPPDFTVLKAEPQRPELL